jgi:hypothetical protein
MRQAKNARLGGGERHFPTNPTRQQHGQKKDKIKQHQAAKQPSK